MSGETDRETAPRTRTHPARAHESLIYLFSSSLLFSLFFQLWLPDFKIESMNRTCISYQGYASIG